MCTACFTRRSFIATAGVLPLAGCDVPGSVSDAEVAAMGRKAWSEITSQLPVSRNRDYTSALAGVSQRLLAVVDQDPDDWDIVVFDKAEANAFALPGGKIGVFEGLFDVLGNEDQLAAIVGHEIGHVASEHGKERIAAQERTSAGVRFVAWLLNLGGVEYADEIAAALGLGAQVGLLLPYSRRQELEADALGLRMMAEARFDPREAVELWRRMEAASGRRAPEFLGTHPAPQSRIEAIEEMLPDLV